MNVAGPDGQLPALLTAPLAAAAPWPVRSGAVPPLADRFNSRPETGPDLGLALGRSRTVALIAQPRRAAGASSQDWLGCCGKTQLAAAFAESLWQARGVDLLVWADGSSAASVMSAYADAASALAGAAAPGGAEAAAASFIAWLGETDRRWLVVLDDLADGLAGAGLVPAGPGGQVLITATRAQAAAGLRDALMLELGPFSPREAMSYLVGRLSADPDQRRGAIDLIDDLGCHPVALAQATATIGSSWITCVDYRERFYRRQAVLTAAGAPPPPPPAVSWTLAVDQADQLVPGGGAQACLALAAMLNGRGVPAGVFSTSAAATYIAPDPAGPATVAERCRIALGSLERAGLASLDAQAGAQILRMSPVLQRAVLAAMPPQMREQAARTAAAALHEAWPEDDRGSGTGQLLRGSAVALLLGAGDTIWADGCPAVLIRAGQSLDRAGLASAAVEYWRDVAGMCDQVLGPSHPDSMRLVEHLAGACKLAGRPEEAIAWRQRIAEDRARSLGTSHPAALLAQVSLGRSLAEAGDFGGAAAVLDAVMAQSDHASGPEASDVREELAAGYLTARQPENAIRLLRSALSERERAYGPANRDTIGTRQRLAEAYLAGGRLKDAVSQYRRVVGDRERVDGPDHRSTLRARGALAAAYQQAGKIGNALTMYEETRDGCQRALGADDPDTLAACVSLAQTYQTLGMLGNATALLRETAARCERVLAPGDPITVSARATLAAMSSGLG
jgi:tetratricopeptide (TPR) repeat protein